MPTGWLAERLASFGAQPALQGGAEIITYKALADAVRGWQDRYVDEPVGRVVVVQGEASPGLLALLIALLDRGDFAVPLAPVESVRLASCAAIAQADRIPARAGDAARDGGRGGGGASRRPDRRGGGDGAGRTDRRP